MGLYKLCRLYNLNISVLSVGEKIKIAKNKLASSRQLIKNNVIECNKDSIVLIKKRINKLNSEAELENVLKTKLNQYRTTISVKF